MGHSTTTTKRQAALAALFALAAAPAAAQSPPLAFPADDAFTAVSGGDTATFSDAAGDVTKDALDVVGDEADPAIFIAATRGFLFLRMRLDGDPCARRDGDECVDL